MQKRGFIKIDVFDITDSGDDVHFGIFISNGYCSTYSDFYGDIETFKDFSFSLKQFPQSIKDVVLFDVGEDNEKCVGYMYIKAFCYDASAHTALRIRVDNHGDEISSSKSEFTIVTEAASINELGVQLASWDMFKTKEIRWDSSNS